MGKLVADPLLEYLEKRLGVAKRSGVEYAFFCPFCFDARGKESSSPKLSINLDKMKAHCWACGYAAGSMETLFRGMNGGPIYYEEMLLIKGVPRSRPSNVKIRDMVNEAFAKKSEAKVKYVPNPLPECDYLSTGKGERFIGTLAARKAWKYLDNRGLSDDIAREFDLSVCAGGRFRNRIIMPFFLAGRVVTFTSRWIGENTDCKYLSPSPAHTDGNVKRHHIKSVVYNYDAIVGQPLAFLVEGPFDVFGFYHAGLPAAAMSGTEVSEAQIALLAQLPKSGVGEVCIAFDAGAAQFTDKLMSRLSGIFDRVTTIRLTDDPWEDRDTLSRLARHRSGAVTLADRVAARITG